MSDPDDPRDEAPAEPAAPAPATPPPVSDLPRPTIARRALARLLRPHLPEVPVMSFLEIPDGKPVEVSAIVGGKHGGGVPSRNPELIQ